MADKHIADGEAVFKAVSSAPDVCIVGIVPVPFDSFQTLVSQKQYASTVWARGCSVLNVGSLIAGSQGNTGAGVASGTSLASGDCIILTGSPTVFVEGKPAARHGSLVGMNNMNCVGSLYTLVEPPLVSVKDNTVPCNNPPVTSAALEKMKARKEDMEHGLLAKARQFLDMGSVLKSGDAYAGGLIGKLRPGKIEGAGTVGEVFNASNETGAGVVRGVLGLGWDLVSGVEHLGNSAVQFSLSQTTEELSLDAAILGENIRLGNVCAEGLLQDAKQTLNAAKKAAADEWDNASHASLGDQAEMATRILGLIGSFFVGAGEAKVAGSVSKVSEAAGAEVKIDDLTRLDQKKPVTEASDGVRINARKVKRVKCFSPYGNLKFKSLSLAEKKKYLQEYAKQLKGQQNAINNMSAEEFKAARDAYNTYGRNPLAKDGQNALRKAIQSDVEESIYTSLRASGMSPQEATIQAISRSKEIMTNLAALHEPDMVAGGHGKPVPQRMGNTGINSSIGGSWNQGGRLSDMDNAANDSIRMGAGQDKMNVQLELCRGSV